MAEQQQTIALLAFIGGLSAATGMIIVETVALSTMVCNDLVMPMLLRFGRLHLSERRDLTGVLLAIRRGAIVVVVLLGYGYVRLIGETYALSRLACLIRGGHAPPRDHRRRARKRRRKRALAGLTAGFLVWMHACCLLSRAGWISRTVCRQRPLGIALLRPHELLAFQASIRLHMPCSGRWSLMSSST
jgi:Na+/proline symporter